jgi:hypothetical protein
MEKAKDHENRVDNLSSSEPQAGHQRRPGRWKRAGRFTLKLLLVMAGLFFVMVLGLMLMSSFSMEGIERFRQGLNHADSVFFYGRLLLIGLLIGFWRPFNTWLATVKGWSDEQLASILAGRWWALGMLLLIELLLIQRIHEDIIGMFRQ